MTNHATTFRQAAAILRTANNHLPTGPWNLATTASSITITSPDRHRRGRPDNIVVAQRPNRPGSAAVLAYLAIFDTIFTSHLADAFDDQAADDEAGPCDAEPEPCSHCTTPNTLYLPLLAMAEAIVARAEEQPA
ncbi:hypothetical protein EDD29_0131 [Actinocorallia herbida]|uniref:Uncharacterized protein n=1 Tax=Actinocorallia herbida TaxID=58109 RepID=A0A3N1CMW2_9ACTN|nr:hypothetical protein [Actinocorallia herbida]ROO82650.1 hypothetical protein EDD29_0131 [Actinocorallia herbida]